ncbi:hypothetical protein SCIP_0562 [Scardovia inopinata JCM 12537]|nr:hypothetical protein SCIP_0562 [Scardovia inopinata JCM 12537]
MLYEVIFSKIKQMSTIPTITKFFCNPKFPNKTTLSLKKITSKMYSSKLKKPYNTFVIINSCKGFIFAFIIHSLKQRVPIFPDNPVLGKICYKSFLKPGISKIFDYLCIRHANPINQSTQSNQSVRSAQGSTSSATDLHIL